MTDTRSEIVVIGGGHNGLVAATYLARAGHRVSVYEARSELGGAVASKEVFEGVAARLSRFSYLVSLLPTSIIDELGLRLELRSRRVKSYTPVDGTGLLIERQEGRLTRESFKALTGDDREYQAWMAFEAELQELAAVLEPTLTQPLPCAADLRARVDQEFWSSVIERPLGQLIEARFADDTVRGVVLTDALIGTFTSAHDPSLRQNRCFLYHVIGNGNGEWKVPVGGMGAVTAELVRVAQEAKVSINELWVEPSSRVTAGPCGVLAGGQSISADTILLNCAPATLERLLESRTMRRSAVRSRSTSWSRLPRLRSGMDPAVGFAGTLHLGQGYARLQQAYEEAAAGRMPDPLPCEIYCHSLTDPSILGPRAAGCRVPHADPVRPAHADDLFRAIRTGTRSGRAVPPYGPCRRCSRSRSPAGPRSTRRPAWRS